ncbi:MAG: Hpt domain-containing protein [Campylobacterota bacterium]|nr:Hpt domain-containing protein [Campylobacterota bacterium]
MEYNIDLQQIADELDFDFEDVEMLMEVYLDSTLENIDKLEKAIESNDFESIYQLGHSLKGSSSNLLFKDIASVAKDIEENGKNKIAIDYKEKFNLLKTLVSNLTK